MEQNYKNHIRWYPPHHFIFYPLILLLIAGSVYGYNHKLNIPALWIGMIILLVLIGGLSFMMRQHYALVCQNRIVRLELRLRYFILSGKRLEETEKVLSFEQLAALRFAADDQFVALLDDAVKSNLSPDQIKRSVKDWQADNMRV